MSDILISSYKSSTSLTTQNITTTGSVTNWNSIVTIDCSSGNISVTLPSSTALNKTQTITLKRTDNTNNVCKIAPYGTESLEGVASGSLYLYNQNDSVVLSSFGGDIKILSDNRNSIGSTASFARFTKNVPQTSANGGITVDSTIIFNSTDTLLGTGISVNTTTGIITLKSGSTFSLQGSTGSGKLNGSSAYVSCVWKYSTDGGTTWNPIGLLGLVMSPSNTTWDVPGDEIARATITTTTQTLLKLSITSVNGVISIGAMGDFPTMGTLPWCEISETSRQASLTSTVDYGYYKLSSSPTINVVPFDVNFDTKVCGNLNNTNGVQLIAGKSYSIEVGLYGVWSGASGITFGILCDYTTNTQLPNSPTVYINSVDGASYSASTQNKFIYTPTTNQYIKLRITNSNNNCMLSQDRCWLAVTQIGSTATSSMPSTLIDNQYIPFTPTITATTTNPATGTSADLKACYMIIGKTLKIQFNLYNPNAGTFGSGNYKINISSIPYTMDTSKIRISTNGYDASSLGHALLSLGSSNGEFGKVVAVSNTELGVYCSTPWNTNSPLSFWSSSNHAMGASVCLSFNCEIPIL